MKNLIVKNAILNALATALYIVAVASFLLYAPTTIGSVRTVLIPIAMLLLLVFSAALTGLLIFGRPVIWYLDGKKKEALSLLASTLGFLFVIMVIVFVILASFVR